MVLNPDNKPSFTFHTTILQSGKTATGIEVPPEIVEQLNGGKKPLVVMTINGYTYRNAIAVMGGKYMVGVSAEIRKAANVEGGDKVEINIAMDTEVRTVEIPAELQKALDANPIAKMKFEALSNSKKKFLVIPINEAKTNETKQKRIEKAINLMVNG
ncbi:MAG TPA: YdeI/OmpD-associated family protein [Saprospiraceae bacterium]|nr:YdeI/OmpD-associated family protein [Saprospiraceae bacterium]